MSEIAYRMTNRVQERLKDVLKQKLMSIVMDPAYFFLDREHFVETFQELIEEINKQGKGDVPRES